MSDYYATTALLPDGRLERVKLEDYQGSFVLLLFYPGDFTDLAKGEILAFAESFDRFTANQCQILGCSTDSEQTHVEWTSVDSDKEHGLQRSLPFPLLADHAQVLTRKFDCLDSNQGTAKHAFLLLDPNGAIKHKQIGDNNVAFDVEDALSTLISSKLPVFDENALEASFDEPPNDLPPPPPESPPPESDDEDSKKSVSDAEEAKPSTESAQEEKKSLPPVSPPGEYVFKYDPELQSFEGAKVEKDDNSVKAENEIEVTEEAENPVDQQDAGVVEPTKKDSLNSKDFQFTMASTDPEVKAEDPPVTEKELEKPEVPAISRMKSHDHFASIEEPLEDDAKSNDASSEKEDEANETIASMQEKLKRELTVKRKDEDELPALPVKGEPAIATQGAKATRKDKKKSESSCCTIV